MTRVKQIAFVALLLLAGPQRLCRAESAILDKADIDKHIAAVAVYQEGMSRKPLIAIEECIRQSFGQPETRKYIEQKLAELLTRQCTREGKLFACRQLWIIGSDDSLPALRNMLTDPNTVDMACYAIALNPSPAATNILCEALPLAKGRALIAIVNLLGQRRDFQCIEVLEKLVLGGDENAADAAIAALGKIGGPGAAKLLAGLVASNNPKMRFAATDAYLQCAENFAAQGEKEPAYNMYRRLFDANQPTTIRRAGLAGMASVDPSQAISQVLAAVTDKDIVVAKAAINCARTMTGDGIGNQFAAQLPYLKPENQILLLKALADRGDTKVLPAALQLCDSNNIEVRAAALEAVGRLGGAGEVNLLSRRAAYGPPAEQQAARKALDALTGQSVNEKIIEQLKTADAPIKVELIRSLATRRAREVGDILMTFAGDPNQAVRRASLKALNGLAQPENVPALLDLLSRAEVGERGEIEKSLAAVSRRCPQDEKPTDAIAGRLRAADNPDIKISLINVLGEIADNNSLSVLREALKDKKEQVRIAAIRAIAVWPSDKPVDDMLKVARSGDNEVEQTIALRGYIRMIGLDSTRPAEQAVEMYRKAMVLAKEPAEKILAMSGLANTGSIAGLELASSYLENGDIQQEAEVAILKIAQTTIKSDPTLTRAALDKLLKVSKSEANRTEANRILDEI